MKRYFLIILVLFIGFTLVGQEGEKLTPEQADELIMKYTQEEQDLQTQLQDLNSEIRDLKGEISTMDDVITALEMKKAELENKLEEMSYYVVRGGDWLSKIAESKEVYGHGNFARWTEIFKANRDKIKDPDLIYPGWKLFIPRP